MTARVEPPEELRPEIEAALEIIWDRIDGDAKWTVGKAVWFDSWRPHIAAALSSPRAERDTAVALAETLEAGLEELVKLQSHYAWLLNAHDGGLRKQFHSAAEWMDRMDSPSKIKAALAAYRAASPKSKP